MILARVAPLYISAFKLTESHDRYRLVIVTKRANSIKAGDGAFSQLHILLFRLSEWKEGHP